MMMQIDKQQAILVLEVVRRWGPKPINRIVEICNAVILHAGNSPGDRGIRYLTNRKVLEIYWFSKRNGLIQHVIKDGGIEALVESAGSIELLEWLHESRLIAQFPEKPIDYNIRNPGEAPSQWHQEEITTSIKVRKPRYGPRRKPKPRRKPTIHKDTSWLKIGKEHLKNTNKPLSDQHRWCKKVASKGFRTGGAMPSHSLVSNKLDGSTNLAHQLQALMGDRDQNISGSVFQDEFPELHIITTDTLSVSWLGD